jgi:predicted HicB family RNase H-like nuclease
MTYKGYTGVVEFDEDARIFHGEVIGLCDVITFQGTSVDDLEKAMVESVDFYLEWCKERNKEVPISRFPESSWSGPHPTSTAVPRSRLPGSGCL